MSEGHCCSETIRRKFRNEHAESGSDGASYGVLVSPHCALQAPTFGGSHASPVSSRPLPHSAIASWQLSAHPAWAGGSQVSSLSTTPSPHTASVQSSGQPAAVSGSAG